LAAHFSDLANHLDVLDEMLKSRREQLRELINIHMSMVSYRLNQIMHQLTWFATIFLPITFITGFFGQKFWGIPGRVPFLPRDTVHFFVLGMTISISLIIVSYVFFR